MSLKKNHLFILLGEAQNYYFKFLCQNANIELEQFKKWKHLLYNRMRCDSITGLQRNAFVQFKGKNRNISITKIVFQIPLNNQAT